MEFRVLTHDDCIKVKEWRNETLNALRTPYLLTAEQQTDFYNNIVCDRKANARYWGIWSSTIKNAYETTALIGMAGIENIEWENRRGEISLILDSMNRGNGYGDEAFTLLLSKGFYELNLENVWGVCYECNPALIFWERQINKYKGTSAVLKNMKYYNGRYYRGLYFNFERSEQCQ